MRNFTNRQWSKKQEEPTSYWYPKYKTTTKQRAHKPLWHLNLMLQCFNWFSIPLKRHDTPVNMKSPANSPYCPGGKQTQICFRKQNVLPAADGSTTDVRINISRYQLTKKLNIHLKTINGYQEIIKQYFTANSENKLNANQQNCSWQN